MTEDIKIPDNIQVPPSDGLQDNGMVSVAEALDPELAALHNCKKFRIWSFYQWVEQQTDKIKLTVSNRPPNRLYDLGGRTVFIIGYGSKDGHVVVSGLDGAGEAIHAEPDELRDITDDLKAKHGLK